MPWLPIVDVLSTVSSPPKGMALSRFIKLYKDLVEERKVQNPENTTIQKAADALLRGIDDLERAASKQVGGDSYMQEEVNSYISISGKSSGEVFDETALANLALRIEVANKSIDSTLHG